MIVIDNIPENVHTLTDVEIQLYPLRFLKYSLMHFISNGKENFRDKHPDLINFLSTREENYLPERYKISLSLFKERCFFYNPPGFVTNLKSKETNIFSEIKYPPLSIKVSFNGKIENEYEKDISWMSRFSFYTRTNVWIPIFT